jgi:4-methylaminobutanoate oxidase (formaldehyde-forming)
VNGDDAARLLQWVCDNDVARGAGTVTYTQALNASGGIECDFTVTQLDAQLFLVVTGTAFANHDAPGSARRHGRSTPTSIAITGGGRAGLRGPSARDISGPTPHDLGSGHSCVRETAVGDVPVRMRA